MPSHTKDIFNKLGVLSLPNLIAKSCLCLMHKVYLKAAPDSIVKLFAAVNTAPPRRQPQVFEIPYNRLQASDKTFTYIGPLLYNKTVIDFNKNKPVDAKNLQSRFLKPFKSAITKHLLGVQALVPDVKTWKDANFALYQLKKI